MTSTVERIRADYASGRIFRRELLDETPGPETWNVGRHVIQQRPGEDLEVFYIEREGGMKHPPHWDDRVRRWHDETLAERDQTTSKD